eukprot:INCI16337.1.p1 GENE.INCI16337.1~~INCI16337.1.p1  ORF type:complete len:642 (+),score=110.83 INCI16337.1:153-2078(+)
MQRLVLDSMRSGGQVLVFCANKKWCSSAAGSISRAIRDRIGNLPAVPTKVLEQRKSLIDRLRQSPDGMSRELERYIAVGVAFHNTNLSNIERDEIEAAFRKGSLSVLTATSTLAVGVNLPADRVIIRSPQVAMQNMDPRRCRQMAGRAGRTGRGDGDAFLILDATDTSRDGATGARRRLSVEEGTALLTGELQSLRSSFDEFDVMCRALLELIVLHPMVGRFERDLQRFVASTFFGFTVHRAGASQAKAVHGLVGRTLRFLCVHNFVVSERVPGIANAENAAIASERLNLAKGPVFRWRFKATRLGVATLHSAMDCQTALGVKKHFEQASRNLYLLSDLHLLFLLTPFCTNDVFSAKPTASDTNSQAQLPTADHDDNSAVGKMYRGFICYANWDLWSRRLNAVASDDDPVLAIARHVGVQRGVLLQAAKQQSFPKSAGTEKEGDYKRFFLALALHDLIHEEPLPVVAQRYGFRRGDLQRLQSQASSFAKQALTFCFHLKWERLQGLLQHMEDRLNFGAEAEILPLLRIRGLGVSKARLLYRRGIRNVVDVARMGANALAELFVEEVMAAPVASQSDAAVAGRQHQHQVSAKARRVHGAAVSLVTATLRPKMTSFRQRWHGNGNQSPRASGASPTKKTQTGS